MSVLPKQQNGFASSSFPTAFNLSFFLLLIFRCCFVLNMLVLLRHKSCVIRKIHIFLILHHIPVKPCASFVSNLTHSSTQSTVRNRNGETIYTWRTSNVFFHHSHSCSLCLTAHSYPSYTPLRMLIIRLSLGSHRVNNFPKEPSILKSMLLRYTSMLEFNSLHCCMMLRK